MPTSYATGSPAACLPTRYRDASCSSPKTPCPCCRAASSTAPLSRPFSMPAEELTIAGVMARRRRADPRLQALVSDDDSITYAELDDVSRLLARRLVRAGVGKGDRVGLLMPNGIDWATVAIAVMRVGGILVPLSTLLRPPELLAQLRVASVSHLITVGTHRGRAYLDDLCSLVPSIVDRLKSAERDPMLPVLRRIWVD